MELNASDTRNAKSLKEVVSQAVGNQSIVDFVGTSSMSETQGQKHCLIFDEVDGMSGNQDRGGVQVCFSHMIQFQDCHGVGKIIREKDKFFREGKVREWRDWSVKIR